MNDFIFCDAGITETTIVICKNGAIKVQSFFDYHTEELADIVITFAKYFNIKELYIDCRSYGAVVIDSVRNNSGYTEEFTIHENKPDDLCRDMKMLLNTMANRSA